MCPCEASHGQHFGCDVCKSLRGDSLPNSVQSSSGSVGMGTQAGFLSQRQTPIRPPGYRSGLAISELPRFKQLEIMPRGISGSDVDPRTLCQGSFGGPTECTVPQFFSWRPDPAALATEALQQDWSKERNYAFPPFCLIMRSLAKLRELGGEF